MGLILLVPRLKQEYMSTAWIENEFIERVLFNWILKIESYRKTSTHVERSLIFQDRKKSVPFIMALEHILNTLRLLILEIIRLEDVLFL